MARVLIVDDDELVARLIRVLVRAEGHSVRIAADAAEARRLIASQQFHLLFVDVNMPGESGVDMVFNLRTRGGLSEDVPVVFITAHTDRVKPLQLFGMKNIAVAAKPSIKVEVRAAMKVFLKNAPGRRRPTPPPLV